MQSLGQFWHRLFFGVPRWERWLEELLASAISQGRRQLLPLSPQTTGHHLERLPKRKAVSKAGKGPGWPPPALPRSGQGLAAPPLAFRGSSRRAALLARSGGAERTAGRCGGRCGGRCRDRGPQGPGRAGRGRAARPHGNPTLVRLHRCWSPAPFSAVQSSTRTGGKLSSCWAIFTLINASGAQLAGEAFRAGRREGVHPGSTVSTLGECWLASGRLGAGFCLSFLRIGRGCRQYGVGREEGLAVSFEWRGVWVVRSGAGGPRLQPPAPAYSHRPPPPLPLTTATSAAPGARDGPLGRRGRARLGEGL